MRMAKMPIKTLRKDLHMKPYIPHPVQALKTPDAAKRMKWAEDFLDAVELDYTYPEYILWMDEAIFHLNGTVNHHNSSSGPPQILMCI